MDRKTFTNGLVDLCIGTICGATIYFSTVVYLIILAIAAIVVLLFTVFGGDLSVYGNDEKGNFSGKIVLIRLITVNVGAVIGHLALTMISSNPRIF